VISAKEVQLPPVANGSISFTIRTQPAPGSRAILPAEAQFPVRPDKEARAANDWTVRRLRKPAIGSGKDLAKPLVRQKISENHPNPT
jgi:hypothetical protein